MAIKILLNTTRMGSTVCNAGTSFNTETEAEIITKLESSGGRLVDPTPEIVTAAAIAVMRRMRGDDEASINAGIIAVAGSEKGSDDGLIQRRSVTITVSDLTEAVDGAPQQFNVGNVLPVNARIIGRSLRDVTPFTGGGATEVLLDVGGTDPDAIIAGEDLLAGGTNEREGAAGVNPTGGLYGGQQITATFTPDVTHNLADLTAGAVTIDVLFVVVS
jgi:hypothetical protein